MVSWVTRFRTAARLLFTALFALQTGQKIQYELLQVSPEKLEAAIRQFQRTGGKGLNITVPHKSEVCRLVDYTE